MLGYIDLNGKVRTNPLKSILLRKSHRPIQVVKKTSSIKEIKDHSTFGEITYSVYTRKKRKESWVDFSKSKSFEAWA